METISRCPKCNSRKYVKHGKVQERQRYLCKGCGYKFTVNKLGKRLEDYYVAKALQLYLEGLGFRAIERVLKISNVTVINWVKKYGSGLNFVRCDGGENKVVEVDELCTYIGEKKTSYGAGLLLSWIGKKCWVLLSETEQS